MKAGDVVTYRGALEYEGVDSVAPREAVVLAVYGKTVLVWRAPYKGRPMSVWSDPVVELPLEALTLLPAVEGES